MVTVLPDRHEGYLSSDKHHDTLQHREEFLFEVMHLKMVCFKKDLA